MVLSLLRNGKDFVTKKQDTILSAALVIIIATVATKILGIVKIILLSHTAGTGIQLDLFYAANTIPEMLFNILVLGALNTALIPVLSECLNKKNSQKMWQVFNSFLNLSIILLFITGILGIIFSDQIGSFFLHPFPGSTSKIEYTVQNLRDISYMIKILFISPIILGVSFMVSGVLLVYKRFLITQVASVMYTLGFVISIFFYPTMKASALCWGVVLGSLLHLFIQLPVLKYLGMEYKFSLNIKDIFLRKIGNLMLPRVIGLSGEQFSDLVDNFIAVHLIRGSLSALQYAYAFYLLPISLIGWSFSQAAFTTLAEEYSQGKYESFKLNFMKSLQQILYLVLPLTLIIIILRLPIVRLVLGVGQGTEFNWDATLITSWILFFLGLNIIFQSILSLFTRAFYAMQDTRVPVISTIVGVVTNLILSIYLVGVFSRFDDTRKLTNLLDWHFYFALGLGNSWMAVGGLALAGTISSFLTLIVLFFILSRRMNGFGRENFWIPLTKKLISAAIMGGILYAVYKTLDNIINTSKTLEVLFLLGLTIYIGMSAYIIMTYLLGDEEVEFIYKLAQKLKSIFYTKKNIPSLTISPDFSSIKDNTTI